MIAIVHGGMLRFVVMAGAAYLSACGSDTNLGGSSVVSANGGSGGVAATSKSPQGLAAGAGAQPTMSVAGAAAMPAGVGLPTAGHTSVGLAGAMSVGPAAGGGRSALGGSMAQVAGSSGVSGAAGVQASAAGKSGSSGIGALAGACDPAAKTPPAKELQYSGKDSPLWENGAKFYEPDAVTDTDTPNTGPYKITIEVDPTADTFTIYRPEHRDRLLPIVAWANGGCFQDGTFTGEFLKEISSYGFLVIADGPPGGSDMSPSDGTRQKAMVDWALKENERPCSTYYHTLNTEKIAVTGGSCGGLMTFYAASDTRVTTAVLWNSGLFERDQKLYDSLHAPMAIFDGGEEDPAYQNALEDIKAIDKVPVLFANDKRGHAGYQWDDNGGEAAKVGVAWFNWHLLDDTGPTGKSMFVGADCGMCKNTKVWTNVDWKNEQLLKN